MTINTKLLRRTLGHIETYPASWHQADYRCQSGMCFAGWTCHFSNGTWATDPADSLGSFLIAEPDDGEKVFSHEGMILVSAHVRAQRLLGLTGVQAARLFYGGNTLDDLRRMVTELCGEAS